MGVCNYLSLGSCLLLATPLLLQMDLPMELSLKSSRLSSPSSMCWGSVYLLYGGFIYAYFNVAHIQECDAEHICQSPCFQQFCLSFIRHEQIFEFSKAATSSTLCFNEVVRFL